jgi:Semialdehyde dehydrogenase, NAD binding domain
VVGASGFAGALAAAIAWRHPQLALEAVTARSDTGRRLDDLYPRYRIPLELEPFDADALAERADVAFVSYPHGAAAEVVADLHGRGLRIVDLSADFRLQDPSAGTARTARPGCGRKPSSASPSFTGRRSRAHRWSRTPVVTRPRRSSRSCRSRGRG